MENKYNFKINDWIISDNCSKPTAYKCIDIDKKGFRLDHPLQLEAHFGFDNRDLRLAKQSEIPEQYRIKYNYYFY